jgi:tRNA dimethylallyltransferase
MPLHSSIITHPRKNDHTKQKRADDADDGGCCFKTLMRTTPHRISLTPLLFMLLPFSVRPWILRPVRLFSMSTAASDVTHKKFVLVIAGPTGVGKSDVAARLCKSRKGMVISADSVQAFRGVQIGANKPSAEERMETPHLLIDLVNASETYNAAEWQRDALFCIQSLLQEDPETSTPRQVQLASEIASARIQQKRDEPEPLLPVVVGGTMMYLQWLVHGRPDAVRPSETAVKRATEIMAGYQTNEQWDDAVKLVSSFGEAFEVRTRQLSGQDWYRLRRTLESAYTVEESNDPKILESLYSGEREGGLEASGYDVRCFFLCPDDRMNHTEIVDRRCEDMLLRGLLKETTDLEISNELPEMAARAIGYRQTLDYLKRENFSENDGEALDAFLNEFTTATRRYAKKQMQWFRRDGTFVFVPVPIAKSKQERVIQAAEAIERMCSLPRDEFELELKSSKDDDDDDLSISEQMKRTNEEQGKGMKFYQFKRHLIKPRSDCYARVMKEADECSRRLRDKPAKKQRKD